MKILLVCSTGGHFKTLQQLRPFWEKHDRIWVTFHTTPTEIALKGEKVYWAYSPTNRNIPNLIRNFWLAWTVVANERPHLVLSTGAGVAVPFMILAKLFGGETAFVESITRVKELSLSARLVLPFLDALYVHWQQLQTKYPKAELIAPLPDRTYLSEKLEIIEHTEPSHNSTIVSQFHKKNSHDFSNSWN
jgi:beta-1,4-N-acetylglucosaminyltransferase